MSRHRTALGKAGLAPSLWDGKAGIIPSGKGLKMHREGSDVHLSMMGSARCPENGNKSGGTRGQAGICAVG